ncbi:hypothetical protein FIBSPDRAFT_954153 [Athelia psychrophila]|uniref:Uncharacterized protein n=1 Tax=Athelia psychrophila TaxID=1759441 RepID=A0A166JKV4_9AGAM|nr:hypothetical protein FIBSPDRAFT_954153 [Fibularhizoctonia sp. CBS 109695]
MSGGNVADDITHLMATAMAVGATSSDIVQTKRTLHSPDGEVNVTHAKIMFTFHHPCDHSPYHPPLESTLAEATLALLRGEWPIPSPIPSPRLTTPASPPRNPSPISISGTTSRSCSPPAYIEDAASLDRALAEPFSFAKVTGPHARRHRRARKMAIPPAKRWYTVTRGLCVGTVQGVVMVRAITRGMNGAVVEHYPSQELAEAVFDLALRAGFVEVV